MLEQLGEYVPDGRRTCPPPSGVRYYCTRAVLRIDYTVSSLYAFSLAIACIYFRLARLPPRFENEVDRPRFGLFSLLASSFLPTPTLTSIEWPNVQLSWKAQEMDTRGIAWLGCGQRYVTL